MAAANFNIPPPAKFDSKPDDWDHWIKRYELFEVATERDGLSDKVRINTLIYVIRNNAADIYDSFKLIGEEIQYANVKQKFKDHFKGKVALVFDRTQFVRRYQQDKKILHVQDGRRWNPARSSYGALSRITNIKQKTKEKRITATTDNHMYRNTK